VPPLGSLDINVSLPQATNGRFTEGIPVSSLTEVGRQRQFAVKLLANVGIRQVSTHCGPKILLVPVNRLPKADRLGTVHDQPILE